MSDHAVKKNGQCHDDCTACHVERLTEELKSCELVMDEFHQKNIQLQAVLNAALSWYDDPYAERGPGTGALSDAIEQYRALDGNHE